MAFGTNPLLDGRAQFLPGVLPRDWIKEAVQEGEGIMQADPMYEVMDRGMDAIMGKMKARIEKGEVPEYLSRVVINDTRRAARRHVSALTDIKPVYAWRTQNPNFQQHALMLNQASAAWWITTFADLQLADAVRYACAAGSGDLVCEWDPFYGKMGNIRLFARDSRDSVPIRPSRDGSMQNWYGVVIREAHSPNVMRALYPQFASLLTSDVTWGKGVFTKFKRAASRIMGGGGTLAGLSKPHSGIITGDEIILYRAYFNDPSVNTTGSAVTMGTPGTPWSYVVEPGHPLYPYKRLVVCTETYTLYDGPNTYWHGMFPVCRLTLDHWPWTFFGLPLVEGLEGISLGINAMTNSFIDVFRQHAHPGVIADAQAMPEHMLRQLDTRQPGWKARVKATFGQTFTQDRPADLPPWSLEFFMYLRQIHAEQSGTANLDALQAAKSQMPSADSIEAYMSALSPELKLEGRQVELCLRDLAGMMLANFFQFYDQERRQAILGEAGLMLEDFDMDTGNLVPAMQQGQPGYLPQLDGALDRMARVQFFLKLFSFYVTPNSLLALNAQTEQMKYVQLARAGYVDYWTLLEKLEVPNVGSPPLMPLPSHKQPTNDIETMAIAAGMVPGKQLDPMTGMVLELREPQTITERLQAQAILGIGMSVNPAGRKASGQAPPSVEEKPTADGGKRITMTESRK